MCANVIIMNIINVRIENAVIWIMTIVIIICEVNNNVI